MGKWTNRDGVGYRTSTVLTEPFKLIVALYVGTATELFNRLD